MNERIQKLAEQAGMRHPVMGEASYARFDYEKFAQLLIMESIGVVNKRYMGNNNREDFEVRRCVEDLKKHFGFNFVDIGE